MAATVSDQSSLRTTYVPALVPTWLAPPTPVDCRSCLRSDVKGCVHDDGGARPGFTSDRRVVAQEGGRRVTPRETDQSHSMKDHAITSAHGIDLHRFLTDRLSDCRPRPAAVSCPHSSMRSWAPRPTALRRRLRALRGSHKQPALVPPRLDTRAGTLDVAIPKPRSGSYFPDSENDGCELVVRV